MHIEWNRVTWYSKVIAVIVFLITAGLFFELGAIYGKAMPAADQTPTLRPLQPSTALCNATNIEGDFNGFVIPGESEHPSTGTLAVSFADAPSGTIGFRVYHSDRSAGPWTNIDSIPYYPDQDPGYVVPINDINRNNYYFSEALSKSGSVLKTYSPMCVSPYKG